MLKHKLICLLVSVAIVMGLALITPMPVQAKAEFVLKLAHADAVDLYIWNPSWPVPYRPVLFRVFWAVSSRKP